MAIVTRTGVKWVKVSKTDALGNSYNDSWKINNSFRLNYADPGNTQYTVNSVIEYPTYWLLGLDYVNITSSLQGARNYTISASLTATTQNIPGAGVSTVVDFTPTINPLNYWIAEQSAFQTYDITPNIQLRLSGSILLQNADSSANIPFNLQIIKNGEEVLKTDAYTLNALSFNTYQINTLINPTPSDYYQIKIQNNHASKALTAVRNGNTFFRVTQSIAPASNTLTILDPFITQPFEGTDCDVTYGWVQSYPYSQYYMDVDYADSATVPVNQQLLISGTATPAQVKDYYYEANRHTLPRYKGSRASSLNYNEYTGPIDTNINIGTPYGNYPVEGYQGDTSYGKVAAIDQYKSYAARFQYIAGYGPEMYNALLVYVTDIVDELGTVQQPKLNNPSYYNLVNAFNQGEQATIKLLDAQGSTQFAGLNNTFNIIRAGKRIETPLYTYTGSATYVTTPTPLPGISFEGTDNTPRFTSIQYSSSAQWSGVGTTINTNFGALISASNITRPNGRFVANDGYKLLPGDSASYSTLTFGLTNLQVSIAAGYQGDDNWVNIKFVSSSGNPDVFPNLIGTTYSVIKDFKDFKINKGAGTTTIDNIIASQVQVQEGFYYYFIIAASSFGTYAPVIKNYWLYVNSDYPFNTAGASDVIYATGSYFVTSSTSRALLSASSNLTTYYGKTQTNLTGSGFNPPIPFTIQEGDQIRFGGNELFTHTIYNVQDIGSNIVFNIDPPLSTAEYNMATVNAASIRRFTDDPNTIIIAGNKAAGGTPGGVIKPKYTTQALEAVIDNNTLFTLQSGQSSS